MPTHVPREPEVKLAKSAAERASAAALNPRAENRARSRGQVQRATTPSLPNRTGLPDQLKAGVESLSGLSLDQVRVHRNSSKPAQLNAHAYAHGSDIHLAPGQEKHLPHEAWHVVQQAQGRVKPTSHLQRVAINDDPALEHEADVMGTSALRVGRSSLAIANPTPTVVSQQGHRLLQRAAHRPAQGSNVRYQGQIWTVQASVPQNPQITIWRAPNHTVNLQWTQANYTIIRANNANDYDLRQNDPGAAIGPVDAYDPEGFMSQRETQILTRFSLAKQQALTMIKNIAIPQVQQQYQQALQAITLNDFHIDRQGPTLVGPSHVQPAEWSCAWREGGRRTWHFVIDVDNPLPDSTQEPHVGWTVSASPGTHAGVPNVFGHVWLDHVPVYRA